MNKGRDERVHYLYLILLPDGRGYIGVSADPDRRFSSHCAPSAGTFISKAILHHGRHSCHFKILCEGHASTCITWNDGPSRRSTRAILRATISTLAASSPSTIP